MIIRCENCGAGFKLDENLLREGKSKVRCSMCKHVFKVYPPSETPPLEEATPPAEKSPLEETAPGGPPAEEPEETVILDSPPDLDEMGLDEYEPPGPDSLPVAGEGAEDQTSPADSYPEAGGPGPSVDLENFDLDDAADDVSVSPGDELDFSLDEDLTEDISSWRQEVETLSPEDIPDEEEEPPPQAAETVKPPAPRSGRKVTRIDQKAGAEGEEMSAPPPREEPVAQFVGKKRRRSLLLPILVLVLLAGAGGLAAVYFFAPGLIPDSLGLLKSGPRREASDPGVRRLSFDSVKGYFITTEAGTKRFVVRGDVVNEYPTARSFIQIRAAILDSSGKVVMNREVYAGNVFSGGELRGKTMEQLEERMQDREGSEDNNVNIPPNGKIPFMAVFKDLPEDISEFTVEAVGSSPAKGR